LITHRLRLTNMAFIKLTKVITGFTALFADDTNDDDVLIDTAVPLAGGVNITPLLLLLLLVGVVLTLLLPNRSINRINRSPDWICSTSPNSRY
jgi:hypothetical protein